MARKIIWVYTAEEDLYASAGYIHKYSPAYAASLVDRVLGSGRSLNEFAECGHIVPELRDDSIREVFIYSYRLVSSMDRI